MLQRRLIAFCTGLLFFLAAEGQVNLQTGSATFTMPMFNWADHKSRLKLNIALDYNSGNGVKVTDVASNVGQGWNLFAGGVIVRLPIGEPDDQKQHGDNNDEHDITKYPDGFLHTTRAPGDGCPLAMTRYPIYGGTNEKYRQHNEVAADKQLDYFSFQFNGKSGMFVLDPKAPGGNKCVSLADNRMIITFTQDPSLTSQGIRTTITSFTIQDDDGLIYKFRDHGLYKVLESRYCDKNLSAGLHQPNFKAGGVYHQAGFENPEYVNPWIIGSWYLSEIEDPLTHRTITFSYETRSLNNVAGADISWDQWHDYIVISHKTSVTKVPFVTSIVCPDGNKVTFKYGKERIDMPGDKVLSAVDITYSAMGRYAMETRYVSRYQFNTSYFILNRYGNPTSAYQKRMARLCLRSVKKIGPDLKEDSPPYSFDYYTGSNSIEDFVPPPFCVSHDIWGYFNGFNSGGYANNEAIFPTFDVSSLNFNQLKGLCYLRNGVSGLYLNPKGGYGRNGLLKQIIYPTGGALNYEYQQNRGVLNVDGIGTEREVGGVHVSKTSATDGGYSNGCDNPVVTNYNFVTNAGQSSLWGLEMPRNTMEMSMHYEPEKRNYRWSLRKCGGLLGCCYYAYVNPGILSQSQGLSLNDFQKFMANNQEFLNVLSNVMTVVDIVVVALGSTGVLSIVALALDVIANLLELGITCFRDMSKDGTTITHHSIDMNGVSPLPAQFKRVEVVEGGGANGKTVHVFTSSDDYPLWVKHNPNLSARQRFGPWLYGLPKFVTEYDGLGRKVSETEQRYFTGESKRMIEPLAQGTPTPPHGVPSNLVNCKCVVKKNNSQRYTDWEQPAKYNADYQLSDHPDMGVEFYPLYTGKVLMDSMRVRVYRKGDESQYVESLTRHSYDINFEYLLSVETRASDGSSKTNATLISKNMSGGLIDVMKQNNILTEPIVKKDIKILPATDILNQTAYEYVRTANGDIRLYRTLEQRRDKPFSNWDAVHYSGPTTTDYSTFKVTSLLTYDNSSNLVNAIDEGGRSIANIYDYNDKHIIASVINAHAVDDKPAYTSFETNKLGGWALSATANYSNNAVTGVSSLDLAGNSCTATGFNTTKPYILSFWAGNGNVTVSAGATLVKSAPLINGFTYYEYHLPAGTAGVSLTGNGIIDELRVYPKNAMMRTSTYDPLMGKTSECDENNHITYYEYDNLARLQYIKDENRNIVKVYEYNNVSKQNGCPQIYFNQEITEYFSKTCVGDFIGSEVPYTVPANKFSSTISQQDADAQAEIELLREGQDKADREGHCIPVYYNAGKSKNFVTDNCPDGYYGGTVTYTVPARKYHSTVQGEVEKMEDDDIAANGQVHANDPAYAICIIDREPDWVMVDGGPTECRQVGGVGHRFVQVRDANPNSPSYNSYDFKDNGADPSCPSGPWYSEDVSGDYRSNCPAGWYGYNVYISMPAGAFMSNVSQEDANNQARAEAQRRADQRYYCEGPPVYVGPSNISSWWPDNPYFEVVFQNAYTGEFYSFAGYGSISGYGIPEGAYDIWLNVTGSRSDDYDLYVCGFTAHGSGAYISRNQAYISENGCNTFSIYPHDH